MTIHRNQLSTLELAVLGLFMDDPYGDGIRLEKIRHPSVGRRAAIDLVTKRQFPLDGHLIWGEYGHLNDSDEVWRKDGTLRSWISRNNQTLRELIS